MTYSPLRYPGGKGQMYNDLMLIFENNDINKSYTYAEPFAGGAGIAIRLLLENKVNKILINDLDISIYCFWQSIVYNSDKFIEKIESTDITIDEWYFQKEIQNNKCNYNIFDEKECLELGFSTFFLNRTNRSGIISAGPIGGKKQNGNYLIDCRFNKEKMIELIKQISKKKNKISITNMDVIDFIDHIKYYRKIFLFIDPPYYKMGSQLYHNSLNHEDHVKIEMCIRKKLKKKKWIVTYDICDEIGEIYKNHKCIKNDLRYSLSKKIKENEYLFYKNIKLK